MEKSVQIVEDLLKKIAREQQYEDHKLTIKQITSGGANYSSYIYTATISSAGKEDLKLFFKIAALGAKMREMAVQIYSNEVFFYTKFMDICRQLEMDHEIPHEHKFRTAKYYGSSMQEMFETLVLEDLFASGYQNFDRFTDLTWGQTAESLEQLAKFHALSVALSIQKPEVFGMVKQSFKLAVTEEFSKEYITSLMAKVIEATEVKNKDRIANFIDSCLKSEKFYCFCKPIRKEVITHGDYRPNNLMYKVEDGKFKVVILDHQTLHTGSPTFDFMSFIFYGLHNESHRKYFQTAKEHYYNELSAALRRLKVNPNEAYSREDFEYELKEALPFALTFGFCGLLVVTVNEDEAPTEIENLGVEDFAFTPNETYRIRLKSLIDFYTEIGVIP